MNYIPLRGVIHGNAVELEGDAGIADGQHVEVLLRPITAAGPQPGDGFLRTEGALEDDTQWDAIMEEIQRSRKQERQPGPDGA